MDVPSQALEHGVLHGDDVLGHEVPPAQVDEARHAKLAGLVELDGQVEGGHCRQLEDAAVDGAGGEVPVQVGHGDGHDLAVEVEVVDDLVAPLADLLPPELVDLGVGGRRGLAVAAVGSRSPQAGGRGRGGGRGGPGTEGVAVAPRGRVAAAGGGGEGGGDPVGVEVGRVGALPQLLLPLRREVVRLDVVRCLLIPHPLEPMADVDQVVFPREHHGLNSTKHAH